MTKSKKKIFVSLALAVMITLSVSFSYAATPTITYCSPYQTRSTNGYCLTGNCTSNLYSNIIIRYTTACSPNYQVTTASKPQTNVTVPTTTNNNTTTNTNTTVPKTNTSTSTNTNANTYVPNTTQNTNTTVSNSANSVELEVVRLVNEERTKAGLKPLTYSAELSKVARTKSQDMADKNYFSHTSPTYGDPFAMMKSFGISYRTAGENIAKGYSSAASVMNGWMNSEGHRANILNGSFGKIGVGYVVKNGTTYWTQMFTD